VSDLESKMTELERQIGAIWNIIHFLITSPGSNLKPDLRDKLWKMMDAELDILNGKTNFNKP